MPATQEVIYDIANILLAEHTKLTLVALETIGKNWVANFISRRPELKSKYIRKYDYRRAKCEDLKVIYKWFDLV